MTSVPFVSLDSLYYTLRPRALGFQDADLHKKNVSIYRQCLVLLRWQTQQRGVLVG